MHLLPSSFFERHTLEVAKDLLGKVIVVNTQLVATTSSATTTSTVKCAARIVEVEAYREDDPASHSSKGRTPRTAVMFGPPGYAYIYHIHRYRNLNFITEPEGTAGGVLIRAVEPIEGIEHMRARRVCENDVSLTNGPGKLAQSLGLNLKHNGVSLQGPTLGVFDDGFRPGKVHATRRIGITRAVEREWRFIIAHHPYLSGKKSLNALPAEDDDDDDDGREANEGNRRTVKKARVVVVVGKEGREPV